MAACMPAWKFLDRAQGIWFKTCRQPGKSGSVIHACKNKEKKGKKKEQKKRWGVLTGGEGSLADVLDVRERLTRTCATTTTAIGSPGALSSVDYLLECSNSPGIHPLMCSPSFREETKQTLMLQHDSLCEVLKPCFVNGQELFLRHFALNRLTRDLTLKTRNPPLHPVKLLL